MFKNLFQKNEPERVEETPAEPTKTETVLDAPKQSLFDKLKNSLAKTRTKLTDQIDELVKGYAKIDEELFEDLEDILVSSDVGMKTTMEVMDRLREEVRTGGVTDPGRVKEMLTGQLIRLIEENGADSSFSSERPLITLVIGVNGVGKTTSIGKLASNLKADGDRVLLAAADTFRAAAIIP